MRNKIILIFIFLFAGVLYALTLHGVTGNISTPSEASKLVGAGGPFESSHERATYATIFALVHNHSVNLTKEWADFAAPDAGYLRGNYYSLFPPGLAVSLLPGYVLGNFVGYAQLVTYALMPILAVLCILFIIAICRNIFKLSLQASILSSLTFAFATTTWSYSVTIYQHIPTTLSVLVLFYCIRRYKELKTDSWLLPACVYMLYAISIFLDYTNAILLAPLMIYFVLAAIKAKKETFPRKLIIRRSLISALVVFVVIVAGHLYYNKIEFGDWKKFHNTLPRYTNSGVEGGIQGSIAVAEKKTNYLGIFSEKRMPHGLATLLYKDDKGLFFFSPILLLGILGYFSLYRRKSLEANILLSFILTSLLVYAAFGDPWGGWAYGPRYLIPAMAALSIFVAAWLDEARFVWLKKLIFFILFSFSSAIALLGALTSNLVPPADEAVGIGLKHNFLLNLDLLKRGTSASFVYNFYGIYHVTLVDYFVLCYAIILIMIIITMVVLRPRSQISPIQPLNSNEETTN